MRSAEEVEKRLPSIEESAERDCQQLTSFWNREETLAIRRTNVREAARALVSELRDVTSQAKDDVRVSNRSLLAHDELTYVVFEV